jgi:two-component system KDP operon response regulator KdpE
MKGFKVEIAHDGLSGLRKAFSQKPDTIILDLTLPDMDGESACRRIREMSDVPILVLSGLSAPKQMVRTLDAGADEYMVKPVPPDELAARIRALLRRAPARGGDGANFHEPILAHAHLVIDFEKRRVTAGGQEVRLTSTEFRLLSVLAQHRGRVLSHETLMIQVWGATELADAERLRLYISYLRRKLEKDPQKPSLIHTEPGVGYRFG